LKAIQKEEEDVVLQGDKSCNKELIQEDQDHGKYCVMKSSFISI